MTYYDEDEEDFSEYGAPLFKPEPRGKKRKKEPEPIEEETTDWSNDVNTDVKAPDNQF